MAHKQPDIAMMGEKSNMQLSTAEGELIETNLTEEQPATDLRRGFKIRQVNMFAIAGSIGTGLIIGSGQALASGGPGSILIAYLIMGMRVYTVMTAFAEMAIYVPMNKGFSGYATRFVDPAFGFVLFSALCPLTLLGIDGS